MKHSCKCCYDISKALAKKAVSILSIFVFLLSFSTKISAQNYFQQEVNYSIHVSLDDEKNELNATDSIEYTNNSTTSLNEIYFHIWPNAYKNENTALAKQLLENGETKFYYSQAKDRGYINELNFRVNDEPANFTIDSVNIDIGKLKLKTPLLPGRKINITTPFHVKLPSAELSRLGYLGQSYMITQWFPKPAVFDNSGWHAIPYLDQGEFYSEFGSFDVFITLPKNYVVAATGNLQNQDEIDWLNKKAEETAAETSLDDKDFSFPNSSTELKTIHYKASKVHDFAWFADKRFHVLKSEIELPISKRTVTSWAMFTNNETEYWRRCNAYTSEVILKYSDWLGEYPYDNVTAVDGTIAAGTGMEYPMVTVIGENFSFFDFEYTIVHELGHNWFYGILGSNERANPWMDEGMNTYYNLRLFENKYPNNSFIDNYVDEKYVRFAHLKKYTHKAQYVLSYLINARQNLDQECSTKAIDFTDANYGNDVYFKTGFIFHYLEKYLGENTFDSIMKVYYETWKFKHPQPQDLRNIFSQNSNKNLDWFFDDLLSSTKKLDYKIVSIHSNDSLYVLKIKNKADIASPFTLTSIQHKNKIDTKWYDGFSGTKKISFPKSESKFIELDEAWDIPEINRRNNVIRTKGILKKVEPITFQFLGSVENSERTEINYFPVVGFNNYDKVMLGVAFYNNSLIQKQFEYSLVPMYSLATKELNGSANFMYHWNPNSIFQAIEPKLETKKYSFRSSPVTQSFVKISPGINFTIKKRFARSQINQHIQVRSVNIWQDEEPYNFAEKKYERKKFSNNYQVNEINYLLANKRTINPFSFSVVLQQNKKFIKTSLESNYRFSYKKKNKGFDVRVFAGKFLYDNNASPEFGFAMSGNTDYTYDHFFLGRTDNSGLLNQQFALNDGGFKNLTLTTNSKNWLLTLNIKAAAPGKIPLALYADIGKSSTSEIVDYDIGIAVIVVRNIFEIYIPIKQSSDLNQLSYGEKIRFVLHLEKANPFELVKNIVF